MRNQVMLRTIAVSVLAACAFCAVAPAQTIGPDIVNSALVDMARYGTDAPGTTTAYAIGSTTCSRGDMPAVVSPSGSGIRPLVAQNMYRLKTDPGGFQRFEQVGQSWVKKVLVPGGGNN